MAKKRIKFKKPEKQGLIKLNANIILKSDNYEATYIKEMSIRHKERIQAILDTSATTGISSFTAYDEEFLYMIMEEFFDINIDEEFEFTLIDQLSFFIQFINKLYLIDEENKKK